MDDLSPLDRLNAAIDAAPVPPMYQPLLRMQLASLGLTDADVVRYAYKVASLALWVAGGTALAGDDTYRPVPS